MKRQYFGTDGVRGPYGGPVINETFAERLGFAVASWLPRKGRVLIGRDTRASGESLERAIARGLRRAKAEPVSLGVVPTPAVARAVAKEKAVLGVVITASHNPAGDNGIKFFGPAGMKLTDEDESAIESHLPPSLEVLTTVTDAAVPSLAGAADDYMLAAESLIERRGLAGWKIVLDTANGATHLTSSTVLRRLGAELEQIGNAPDGRNINSNVGSEHPAQLAARVRASGARLGIAHDGDGDRCVLCDEQGEVLDGDEILTILAIAALKRRSLVNNALVVTVQSNLGVDAAITALGGQVFRSAVGDRYVIEKMLQEHATLGGESSGHVICADISPTGDGLVAALKVIAVMKETGEPLSQLRKLLRKFPQRTSALKVREKRPLDSLPKLTQEITALEFELGSRGRVLVRYSGTEAKLRLLIEGADDATVDAGLARLERAARAELEVL
jgi:phosphoglucosamine mutase